MGENSAKINVYVCCVGNLYEEIYPGIYVFNYIIHVSKLPIYLAYSREMKNKLEVKKNEKVGKMERRLLEFVEKSRLKLGDKNWKMLKVTIE